MKHSLFLLAMSLFFAFGCEEKEESLPDHQITLDASFSLRPPQVAQSDELKLAVQGINDSRCRPDMQCIWEGEVKVQLGVQVAGRTEEIELILHNPEHDGKNTKVIAGHRITLEWVSMPPSQNTNWKLEDYEIRLKVSKI